MTDGVSMRDYVDIRLVGVESRIMGILSERHLRLEAQFEAIQLAITKSENSIDRRLALLNEFRAQAAEESKKYALIVTADATQREATSRMNRLEDALSELRGRSVALAGFGVIFGGVLTGIVVKLLGG